MSSQSSDSFRNVTRYLGQDYRFTPTYLRNRDPHVPHSSPDIKPKEQQGYYPISSLWTNTVNQNVWVLAGIVSNLAKWVLITSGGSGPLLMIGVPLGTSPISPDVNGLLNFTSNAGTVQITGSAGGTGLQNINFDITGGAVAIEKVAVDANTAPGTNPVVPTAGQITVTGGQVAAGTTTNVIRTDSLAASTYTIEIQRSQAVAISTIGDNGVSHFDSTSFAVDANGFVTSLGGGFTWNDVSGAFSALKNNGYFITATATGNLPAAPSQGNTIKFFVDHPTQLLTIKASGTQIIRMGSAVTAAAGTAVSTAQGDSVELVYRAADTCWCAISGFSGIWVLT